MGEAGDVDLPGSGAGVLEQLQHGLELGVLPSSLPAHARRLQRHEGELKDVQRILLLVRVELGLHRFRRHRHPYHRRRDAIGPLIMALAYQTRPSAESATARLAVRMRLNCPRNADHGASLGLVQTHLPGARSRSGAAALSTPPGPGPPIGRASGVEKACETV